MLAADFLALVVGLGRRGSTRGSVTSIEAAEEEENTGKSAWETSRDALQI